MFSDYKAAIMKDYHLKKADGSLSLNLMNPTPAGLKNESLIVLETRTGKEDFKTLRLFFGEKENEGDYERTIRNTDTDKFRPLSNFLKRKTTNNNLELFTMGGKHPEQPEKRLRPLSKYMYDKYVVTGKVKVD